MRIAAILTICCLAQAARPAETTAPKKGAVHKSTKSAGVRAKSSGKHGKTAAKRGKNSRAKSAQTWRSRQLAPTPERYKEIQAALADRGYLKSQPNGVWDAPSADALKHFQQDQNLEPNGKLNSLSLIALGLGAKRSSAGSPAKAPAAITPRTPAIESPAPPVQSPGSHESPATPAEPAH